MSDRRKKKPKRDNTLAIYVTLGRDADSEGLPGSDTGR